MLLFFEQNSIQLIKLHLLDPITDKSTEYSIPPVVSSTIPSDGQKALHKMAQQFIYMQ